MKFSLIDIFSPQTRRDTGEQYRQLYREGRKLVSLEVENARLMLTEKLSLLLGRIALVAVCFVIAACVVIFLSMSISDLLLQTLAPWATYMIVAGFYILLIIIVALCRQSLIIDPIARYLSSVLLDPPANERKSTVVQPQISQEDETEE